MPVASDSNTRAAGRKGRSQAQSGAAPAEPAGDSVPLSGGGAGPASAVGSPPAHDERGPELALTKLAAAAALIADAVAPPSTMPAQSDAAAAPLIAPSPAAAGFADATAVPPAALPEAAARESAAAPSLEPERSEAAGAGAGSQSAGSSAPPAAPQQPASLTLSSKNYSSWSLRGWLMARFAGIEFTEVMVSPDDADARRELLLMAPSIRVPCLTHDGARVWNTLAIAQYLDEIRPDARLMPADRIARAHCRSISGEMNSGFANLRASLPMNLKARFPGHKIWAGAQPDIDRIVDIWTECLATYGGPFLFGAQRGMADAMFAPVVTRFLTYDVKLSKPCILYCQTIMAMPEMQEWIDAAKLEPDDIDELEMDF